MLFVYRRWIFGRKKIQLRFCTNSPAPTRSRFWYGREDFRLFCAFSTPNPQLWPPTTDEPLGKKGSNESLWAVSCTDGPMTILVEFFFLHRASPNAQPRKQSFCTKILSSISEPTPKCKQIINLILSFHLLHILVAFNWWVFPENQ